MLRGSARMLEQSESLSYLLSLGLVKPRFMANGDLAVEDASRRNRVFLVTRRGGPTHVVKQAGPAMANALRHEASVLRTLAGIPGLAERVPDVAYEDPEAGVLVLRSPAGAPDWIAVHRAGRFPRL